MKAQEENNQTHSSGITLAFVVLGLHVLLLLGVGAAVVLIKGIYDLRWALFALAAALITLSAYVFYQRFKTDRQQVARMMRDPALAGRSVEISLLGGMASVKVGDSPQEVMQIGQADSSRLLGAPQQQPLIQIDELSRLKQMLDEGLLEMDEFRQLKKEVLARPPAMVADAGIPCDQQLELVLPPTYTSTENVNETDELAAERQKNRVI